MDPQRPTPTRTGTSALVLAGVVGAVLAILAASLLPGMGRSATRIVPGSEISETLEAAKLQALARGSLPILAGPGRVVVPERTRQGREFRLWQHDDGSVGSGRGDARIVTLTVEVLGDCSLFLEARRLVGTKVDAAGVRLPPGPSSGSITQRFARNVSVSVEEDVASDCAFLWVLRES